MAHPVPFMKATTNVTVARKSARDAPDLEEAIEEEDDADVVAEPVDDDEEEELDLKKDKYIKQPKAKAKRAAPKKSAKAKAAAGGDDLDGDDGDDGDDAAPKARGKAKAAPKKPAGRGKK